MPFEANFRKPQQRQDFKRTEFIELPVGQHTIRILAENPPVFDTHYVKGITLRCLGDD